MFEWPYERRLTRGVFHIVMLLVDSVGAVVRSHEKTDVSSRSMVYDSVCNLFSNQASHTYCKQIRSVCGLLSSAILLYDGGSFGALSSHSL